MGLSGDSGLGSTYYGPSKMTSLSGFHLLYIAYELWLLGVSSNNLTDKNST